MSGDGCGVRCDGSSGCLQYECEDVKADEGGGVRSWSEAGDAFAVGDDDAGEAEVDGAAEEDGADG